MTFSPLVRTRAVRYHENAARLFAHLGGTVADDAVLLESADIASKEGLHSVMVLRGSVRVTCNHNDVTAEPLTPSGVAIVQRLAEQLSSDVSRETSEETVFHFPVSTAVDERERLTALSSVEPLRRLQTDAGYLTEDASLPFLAGGIAFDHLASFEELPSVEGSGNTYPDYQFLLAEVVLSIDHQAQSALLAGVVADGSGVDKLDAELDRLAALCNDYETQPEKSMVSRETIVATASIPDADYRAMVTNLQAHIHNGDIYQVVPARSFTMPCPDAFAAYQQLKEHNPSPYMFYVRGQSAGETYELFGASPESNLKFTADTRIVELYPIAGTRPRGLDPDGSVNHELDIRAELELRTDAKEISEHTMLVDLARNDLARVAVPATRRVEELLQVDRYSRVMHLVSRVSAELAPDLDALDAYRACMNMGTLTGAPKIRATELLREAEGTRRGSYGGAVGYLRGNGDMDTCIVIRSAFVSKGVAIVQAGAGVVRDSQPQSEADESLHKAYAVLHAIATAAGARLEVQR